jgi:hypothetical protein
MRLKIILALIFSIFAYASAEARVRRVAVNGDQIVTVRTSIGIATIIQVPDRPNSVVVGDQNAFKVEYLDQAITIKPLSSGARSNLYIYTDWKRFNVELVSGGETIADYVVYLDNPKTKTPQVGPTPKKDIGITWTNFKNTLKNETMKVNVNRLGRTKDGLLFVELTITSTQKESFKPEWIWLSQSGSTKPIHNLFLSSLETSSQKAISGVIQLREVDLVTDVPMRLELRRKKISYLTIKKVNSWKR